MGKITKTHANMKLAVLSSVLVVTAAFAPASTRINDICGSNLWSTTEEQQQVESSTDEATHQEPEKIPINGWIPDSSKPCYGLPGVVAPTGYFDPIGFSRDGITLNEVKRYREAEVMHGRVSMLAVVGYFVGESFPGPFGLVGPANDQLQQLPLPVLILFGFIIGFGEINRAKTGWIEPDFGSWDKTLWKLRENYYPGDVGFDPLNLKPSDPVAFKNMQTKELQHGRLAMIGAAGMCAQELVNHRTIFETIDFYNKVYNGINPYEACGDGIIC